MLEEERKYDVGADFTMPELKACLPAGGTVTGRPPATLRAAYYDTTDLRLARSGVSLRYRSGAHREQPWTAKLPTDTIGTRYEITRAGGPRSVPPELAGVLTAYHRGAPLHRATSLRTVRRLYELRDATGALLAEVADDTVAVLAGRSVVERFREIEVERFDGGTKLLDRIDAALRAAGAVRGPNIAKQIRAMGKKAQEPGDLPSPRTPARVARASVAGVLTAALRRDIAGIFSSDAYVRLRELTPDGDTPVHQMRVASRRLRSDLRTFAPVLDKQWTGRLRNEAGWLAGVLGAARDAEVLRARLRRTTQADPIAPLDQAAVARIDADLAVRQEEALHALDVAIAGERYVELLQALLEAARAPQVAGGSRQRAQASLARLVWRPWRELVMGTREGVAAGELDQAGIDADWHSVRIRAKRARYATEAVAPVLGADAEALAQSLAKVQSLLGEHQDAAVAAQTWLAIAQADPDDHALAVTAGRLYERERAAIRRARERFPAAWQATDRPQLTHWLTS
jgi:CHAD domain-containing protein